MPAWESKGYSGASSPGVSLFFCSIVRYKYMMLTNSQLKRIWDAIEVDPKEEKPVDDDTYQLDLGDA